MTPTDRPNRSWAALLVLVAAVSTWCACAVLRAAPAAPYVVHAQRHGVVTSSAPATQVGLTILQRGGNAVDAAVATAFALAVTWPEAGNIGGGGFMMVHAPGREPAMIDYREVAPEASTSDMFALDESVHTAKAAGVPGTVRGLALAHEKFGSLPWRDLVMPAVKLAEEGFIVSAALAGSVNEMLGLSPGFEELERVYGKPGGEPWRAGDRMVLPDLAKTLRAIADQGSDAFYTGPIAGLITAEMERGGGLITREDLAAYRAIARAPVHIRFRDHDIYAPAPPSSGGAALAMILHTLEHFELREPGRYSPDTLHLMAEAMRRAFADRARYLGDSDFVIVPDFLTSRDYGRMIALHIDPHRATPSESLTPDVVIVEGPPGGESTTHFSVIDARGMAVSNTYTIEQSWGSRVVVRGAGFLLNNEMGDFNWEKGHTDRAWRIGTAPNLIQPRKRMLSSMTPVIVTRDGKPVLITGSPGGRTIINTVACVILNGLEFEMNAVEAVAAPRMHHQWLPDRIQLEAWDDQAGMRAAMAELEVRGHTLRKPVASQGCANTIAIDPASGRITLIADRRIDGEGGAAGE